MEEINIESKIMNVISVTNVTPQLSFITLDDSSKCEKKQLLREKDTGEILRVLKINYDLNEIMVNRRIGEKTKDTQGVNVLITIEGMNDNAEIKEEMDG